MFYSFLQYFRGQGVTIKFAWNSETGAGDGFFKLIMDYDQTSMTGSCQAIERFDPRLGTLEAIEAAVIDGCGQHCDRIIIKVSWECTRTMGNTNARYVESARIRQTFRDALVSDDPGAWDQAWANLAAKYPEQNGRKTFWTQPKIKGCLVKAFKRVRGLQSIPASTNGEEATHFQVGRLGHKLSLLRGVESAKKTDDYKHQQGRLEPTNAHSSRDRRPEARKITNDQIKSARDQKRAKRVLAASAKYDDGQRVELKDQNKWVPGQIIELTEEGDYNVLFDGDATVYGITENEIRLPTKKRR